MFLRVVRGANGDAPVTCDPVRQRLDCRVRFRCREATAVQFKEDDRRREPDAFVAVEPSLHHHRLNADCKMDWPMWVARWRLAPARCRDRVAAPARLPPGPPPSARAAQKA